jgi:hypothetical protein
VIKSINRACELLSVLICFGLLFIPAFMIFDASQQRDLWWLGVGLALFWLLFDILFWPVFRAFILRK